MPEPSTPDWSPVGLIDRLAARGAAPALVVIEAGTARDIAAEELAHHAWGAALAMAKAGLSAGDVVAIHAENGPRWVAAGLAAGWLGAVLAPIDAAMGADGAEEMAAAMQAKLLLSDRAGSETLSRLGLSAFEPAPRQAAPPPAPPDGARALALFRTSGTTGTPKIFTLTQRNIGFNVMATAAAGLVSGSDRVLMPLPMHHVFPWIVGTLVPLDLGAPLILADGTAGPAIAAAMRLGRPTVAVGVPRLYEAMLGAIRTRLGPVGRRAMGAAQAVQRATGLPLGRVLFAPVRRKIAPGLGLMVSGGAKLDRDTALGLETLGWDVRQGYGLSETAAIFAGELTRKRPGTVGHPLPGCFVRIDAAGPGGTGEILVKGPNVIAGYREPAEENARAFTADGFFRTGDLGRLDADGFLTVTGRLKEVIVLGGGDNIDPESVEKAYSAAPDIAEIAVLEQGGALVALVVPDMEAIAARGVVKAENAVKVALAGAAQGLPSTWALSAFRLQRAPLPRTRLGKLRRFLLPELYSQAGAEGEAGKPQAPSEDEAAWIARPPRQAVWRLLTEGRAAGEVGLDSHLGLDLGLDSFGWMELALKIEDATGMRLDTARIGEIATVRDLLAAVTEAEAPVAGPTDRAARLAAAEARWLAPRSTAERLIGGAVTGLATGAMRLVYGARGVNGTAIPATGPVLICPNHVSDLDPLALAAALPSRARGRAYWVADAVRVFQDPLYRRLCRALRLLPADETAPDVTVGLAVAALNGGHVQVWFPEGWRSADGTLLPFQPGIGRVIKASGAPVVPVYIEGTLEAWPRARRLPRLGGRVRVHFGAPVAAEDLAGGPLLSAEPGDIAEALRGRVGELAPKV